MGRRGYTISLTGLFQYTKLADKDGFRVFELLPRRKDGQIHGRLHLRRLTEPVEYVAISYRWGKADRLSDKLIWVEGRPFLLHKNAWQFLRNLQRARNLPPESSIFLWIDAICINQSDEDERSSQVKLMAQIYHSSLEVIAYLGPLQWYLIPLFRNGELDFHRHKGRWGGLSLAGRRAIRNVGEREYWSRSWIVPEIIMAPSIVLFVGKRQVLWESFSMLIYSLQRQLPDMPACRLVEWDAEFGGFQRMDIIEILLKFKRQQCGDPRDGLYSLLSLIEGAQEFPVDYSASTTHVFHAAWAHFSKRTPNSRHLQLAHLLRQSLKLDCKTYTKGTRFIPLSTLGGEPIIDTEECQYYEREVQFNESRICSLKDIIIGKPSSSLLSLPAPIGEVQICRCAACAPQLQPLNLVDLMALADEEQVLLVRRIYTFHETFLVYRRTNQTTYEPFLCMDPIAIPTAYLSLRPRLRLVFYAIPPGLEADPFTVGALSVGRTTFWRSPGPEVLIHPRLLYKILYDMPHPKRVSFSDDESSLRLVSGFAGFDILKVPRHLQ